MGKKARADIRIHASVIDGSALNQIYRIAESPAFLGSRVAIMPDVHAGVGCVIGFTADMSDAACPNVVGVDIGCGVLAAPLEGVTHIDHERLDLWLRDRIPLGINAHRDSKPVRRIQSMLGRKPGDVSDEAREFFEAKKLGQFTDPALQMGTLGGGNHFIEVDRDSQGRFWLVIHSGSRNVGRKVADFFQARAREWCEVNGVSTPRGLEFLPLSEGGDEYVRWLNVAQEYAAWNRRSMAAQALEFFGIAFDEEKAVESVHNYLGDDGIVRKGAISARAGERVLIPLNMADGVIIGTGLGNPDYNWSAPHGAGRRFSRGEMKQQLESGEVTMEQFLTRMDSVYSTSLSPKTIDESPMAYKSKEDILPDLEATVRIEETMVPVHNLKAQELSAREQKALDKIKREREQAGLDTHDLDLAESDITG